MLGVFAELKTNLRRETPDGRYPSRQDYKGRPGSFDAAKIDKLRSQGLGASAIARQLGIAMASVYRAMKERKIKRVAGVAPVS